MKQSDQSEGFQANFLEENFQAGKKWVVIDNAYDPMASSRMKCYTSSREAETYCSRPHFVQGPDGKAFVTWYQYYSIENLLLDLQQPSFTLNSEQSQKISLQLQHLSLKTISGFFDEQTLHSLAIGYVTPVKWPILVYPAEMQQYYIVDHSYSPNPIHPLMGHHVEILARFDDFRSAEFAFNDRCRRNLSPLPTAFTKEYKLIGEFARSGLRLDFMGEPELESGLILKSGQFEPSGLRISTLIPQHDFYLLERSAFAKFQNDKIQILDDNLIPVSDMTKLTGFWGKRFQPPGPFLEQAVKKQRSVIRFRPFLDHGRIEGTKKPRRGKRNG